MSSIEAPIWIPGSDGDPPHDASDCVVTRADGSRALNLVVANLHCPGCMRRIEAALEGTPGLVEGRVNLSTRRLSLVWRPGRLDPGDVIAKVADLGYRLVPYRPDRLAGSRAAEARDLLVALAVAGFAAGNVMLLSISVWSGLISDMGPATRAFMHWISALIALPAVAYAGRPFFRSALAALKGGGLNMDVPISLAVVLAAGMSLFETLRGGEEVYFDASVTLLFFLLIGRYLDLRLRNRARSVAENLMLLQPVSAQVVCGDGTHAVMPVQALVPGMRVTVASGERIAVDGQVVSGRSAVDSGLVTGESLPVAVEPGSEVIAGTLNLEAPLEVEVRAAGEGTLLAELVRLMEAAEQGRDRYLRLADRMARIYAPAVHILALAAFLGWLAIGGVGWQAALMVAVAVLIVTCPCALGLAVPAVQVAATGRLLKGGVLVKSGDALERLAEADSIVFDKTGTLTLGRPELANADEIAPAVLARAAGIAVKSRHPLARALVRAAAGTSLPPQSATIHEHPGEGLVARLGDQEWRLGRRAWCGIETAPLEEQSGQSEFWMVGPAAPPQRFAFVDRPREDAPAVIAALQAAGYRIELLSGDRVPVTASLAEVLGIAAWRGGARPAEKIARLKELAGEGRKVVMVGDGLNDAPALAEAFVSISPSEAADITQTAADVVFQGACLSPLLETLRVSRIARRLMLQNFALALLYNAIAVPLAMAGLVTPLIAAIAMSASSIVVTLNALRLAVIGRGGTMVPRPAAGPAAQVSRTSAREAA